MPDEMLDTVSIRFKLLSEPMKLKIERLLCEPGTFGTGNCQGNQPKPGKHLQAPCPHALAMVS